MNARYGLHLKIFLMTTFRMMTFSTIKLLMISSFWTKFHKGMLTKMIRLRSTRTQATLLQSSKSQITLKIYAQTSTCLWNSRSWNPKSNSPRCLKTRKWWWRMSRSSSKKIKEFNGKIVKIKTKIKLVNLTVHLFRKFHNRKIPKVTVSLIGTIKVKF
jgi:hypothetical protein